MEQQVLGFQDILKMANVQYQTFLQKINFKNGICWKC